MPLLQFDDVCFSYERLHILKKITFAIEAGEFIAVIGPNGGGKTTLLKLMMGLLKPTKGQIIHPPRTSIGYVPQSTQFDPNFPIRVLEFVLMGSAFKFSPLGRTSKTLEYKGRALLKQVGLAGQIERPFATLSGGQKQRALIARALLGDPACLLLDEPTANIDNETEKIILTLLREKKGKCTLVMVTHHLEAILREVDRIFCLQQELSLFSPGSVCEHFGFGSYHKPLLTDTPCEHD